GQVLSASGFASCHGNQLTLAVSSREGSMRSTKSTCVLLPCLLASCAMLAQTALKKPAAAAHAKGQATVAEAEAFMKKAEDQLQDLGVRVNRATWVQENFITDDTEALAAQALEKNIAAVTELALAARRFDGLKMPPE